MEETPVYKVNELKLFVLFNLGTMGIILAKLNMSNPITDTKLLALWICSEYLFHLALVFLVSLSLKIVEK